MVETRDQSVVSNTTLLATFFVGNSLCALDTARVQEVIRVGSFTTVRHAPEQVTGVINLRGKIVTLIDLGMMLGFGKSVITPSSRIFIMEDRNEYLGVLVNAVGEMIEVGANQEESLPTNVSTRQGKFFRAVCRWGEQVITLLNHQEVLNESQFVGRA